MKTIATAFFSVTLFCASLLGQTPPRPSFEVASIKPIDSIQTILSDIQSGKRSLASLGTKVDGARMDMGATSIQSLILQAYKLKPHQVIGPDWMQSQLFEIHATIPEGVSKDRLPEMLQSLLAERFKLVMHRENKDLPVYALIVSKDGPKLKEAVAEIQPPAPKEDTAKPPDKKGDLLSIDTPEGEMKVKQEGRGMVVSGGRTGQMRINMGQNGINLEVAKITMTDFADLLTQFLDRPVVNMTDLTSSYQVAMEIPLSEFANIARKIQSVTGMGGGVGAGLGGAAPETGLSGSGASDPSGGAIFKAIQQLGLKLDSRKSPIETLVVDSVEKTPTEN